MTRSWLKYALIPIACVVSQVHAKHVDVMLAPNATKTVTNHYAWAVNATCNIQCDKQQKIKISVLNNDGSVNGEPLKEGHSKKVIVHGQEAIKVSAQPGTTVSLKNLGTGPVNASCNG